MVEELHVTFIHRNIGVSHHVFPGNNGRSKYLNEYNNGNKHIHKEFQTNRLLALVMESSIQLPGYLIMFNTVLICMDQELNYYFDVTIVEVIVFEL